MTTRSILMAGLFSFATIASADPHGIEPGDINRDGDACTDFFDYANGAWRKANPIPDDMDRWSRRWQSGEINKEHVRGILEEVSARKDWPAGSAEQLSGDFYGACMDEERIDSLGVAPVKPLLGEIAAIRDGKDVQRQLAKLHAIDAAEAPAALVRPAGGRPIEAAMTTIDQLLGSLLEPSPTFSFAVRWLERNTPAEPDSCTIVHSDIRNGNIIVGDDGLRAILDWETARVGDPMEDVAWPCMRMWRFREDERTVGGFAGVDVMREAYAAAGGAWDEERYRWWRVMGTVR